MAATRSSSTEHHRLRLFTTSTEVLFIFYSAEISRDLGAIWGTTERRNFSRFGRDLGTNTRKFETKFGWYVRERQHKAKWWDSSWGAAAIVRAR